jgi:hypothetical protein
MSLLTSRPLQQTRRQSPQAKSYGIEEELDSICDAITSRLPRELRDIIYFHAVVYNVDEIRVDHPDQSEGSSSVFSLYEKSSNKIASTKSLCRPRYLDPQIVGDTIAQEMLTTFYKHNLFHVADDALLDAFLSTELWSPIAPKSVLHHITVHVNQDAYSYESRHNQLTHNLLALQQLTVPNVKITVDMGPLTLPPPVDSTDTPDEGRMAWSYRYRIGGLSEGDCRIQMLKKSEQTKVFKKLLEVVFPVLVALQEAGHTVTLRGGESLWKWTLGDKELSQDKALMDWHVFERLVARGTMGCV